MYKAIFRNRWIAMLWVLGMLVSVGLFFARGGGQERLAAATNTITSGKTAFDEAPERAEALVTDDQASDDGAMNDEEDATLGEEHRSSNSLRGKTLTLARRPAEGDEGDGDEAETYVIIDRNSAGQGNEDY